MVNVYRPESIKDALGFLKNEECTVFSGGTDIMVRGKTWSGTLLSRKKNILLIDRVDEIKDIRCEDGYTYIGSGVTLSDIGASEVLPQSLRLAAVQMASPAIRNIATIGGNIVNSSPAGDMLPPLYAFRAMVVLSSTEGVREVPIEEFITAPGKNILKDNELLTFIKIKDVKPINETYKKVGTRKSIALSKASFCGIKYSEDGKVKYGIAFGSVGPTVVCSRCIEDKIESGKNVSEILKEYSDIIRPIDDQRSSADYRKRVSLRLLEEFIK